MAKHNGGDDAARRRFARAMARAEFGRFYMSERDVAELKQDKNKKPARTRND